MPDDVWDLGIGSRNFIFYMQSLRRFGEVDGCYRDMITAAQMKAARALLGLDQRSLAESAGLSLPTIQRMEASSGVIRGHVESLMKLVAALEAAGIELIAEGAASAHGGRGVRLIQREPQ